MNTWKRLAGLALALIMAVTVVAMPDMDASAKAKLSKKTIVITTKSVYNETIQVTYSKSDKYIKNLKVKGSGSKNLLVRQTCQNYHENSYSTDNGYASLSFFAKKKGTYKVTFDVYNKNDKKENAFTVTVKAVDSVGSYDYPIKSATFDGKTNVFYDLTTKKSGKFKVKMKNGYRLKGITLTYYDKKGNYKTKKIKNNAKVTLSDYANLYQYGYDNEYDNSWSYSYRTDLLAQTGFEVEYQKTKTGATGSVYFSIYRKAKN